MRNFKSQPKYGLAIGGFYAVGGWLLYALLYHFDLPYLFYPLTTGFALVAPFAAAGLYEIAPDFRSPARRPKGRIAQAM